MSTWFYFVKSIMEESRADGGEVYNAVESVLAWAVNKVLTHFKEGSSSSPHNRNFSPHNCKRPQTPPSAEEDFLEFRSRSGSSK